MITCLVKMVFREEEVEAFQQLFEERKEAIRTFEGCTHLELWQDRQHPQTFFTYSLWESEDHLARYRFSPLFKNTWQLTRQKFADPPLAWSINVIHQL